MKSAQKLLAAALTAVCVAGLLAAWRLSGDSGAGGTEPGWFPAFGNGSTALNSGTAGATAPKALDRETWRPSRVPDRIVLSWTKDPARTQAVTWRTDAAVARAVAQIVLADAGPSLAKNAVHVAAVTTPLTSDLGKAHYHTVVFEDLSPKTKYAYRVGDGVNWSEWIHFVTAAETAEPFSFVYFGDAQNDIKSLWSRVIREAYSDAPRARFLIHAGDLVTDSRSDALWGEWFGAAGWVNAMIPCVPTPGNHEYQKSELAPHWRVQFALPENGPDGLAETVYYFDFQGTRVISLNSNVEQERQVAWLEEVLSENRQTWTVVTFHHPLYSSAKARDNARLRRLWKPVFDRFRVDLVLQGHDHTYARTGLEVPENVAAGADRIASPASTVYVVSVSGPKMYGLQRESFMKRAAEQTQLYQIVHIDGRTLKYEAHTATGELYDAFTLKKRPGMANELIEQIPDTPERILPAPPAAAKVGAAP
jgi:3',5'-cyclic AMP phosphodiesterase CpdA